MSKERLETIKELVKKIESILYDEWRQQELTFLIESLYYAGHVDWLIQQAERVQELEEEIRRIRQMKYREAYEQGKFDTNMKVWYEVPKLEQQNKRYREMIDQIKNNIPLEFNLSSEYEAKKNVIRLMNIDNLVNEYLEGESDE